MVSILSTLWIGRQPTITIVNLVTKEAVGMNPVVSGTQSTSYH